MRALYQGVIIGMALALVSPALAGGKSAGFGGTTSNGGGIIKQQSTTAKTGGNTTKGGKQEYLKYNFGTVVTTRGSAGPTAPPKPTLPTTGGQRK